jgi:hypothetical protein
MGTRRRQMAFLGGIWVLVMACQGERLIQPQAGDLSKSGGSASVRESFDPELDDPDTEDDESNDQPLGYFGTLTMAVGSVESGNSYTLDVDIDGTTVERVYFPKGGWIDFYDCELDDDLIGDCQDEEGRSWIFEGESSLSESKWVAEDDAEEEGEASDELEDQAPEEWEEPAIRKLGARLRC